MLLYNSVVFFLFGLFNQNMSSTLCYIFILLFSLSIIWALTFLFKNRKEKFIVLCSLGYTILSIASIAFAISSL